MASIVGMKAMVASQIDLKHFERVAELLDEGVRLPWLPFKVPLDPLIGLIPFGGDIVPFFVSLGLIGRAKELGVPGTKIRRMWVNTGMDAVLGTVPFLGDIFDFFFKAQRRNLKIVRDHVATLKESRTRAP